MANQGIGDRWLAGEAIEGVTFAFHAPVAIVSGRHAGQSGSVILVTEVAEDPLYLVRLAAGVGDVRVRQSAMRAA